MSQNDFNFALEAMTASQLPPLPSAYEIANQMIRRDRRRTRVLAIFCLFFWLMATAGLLVLLFGLNRLILFIRIDQYRLWQNGAAATTQGALDQSKDLMLWGTTFIHHAIPYIAGWVMIFTMLAAMCTVMLIFSSRQGVLNRINLSLAQMSEQLKQLRSPGK
jgi:hypothetical protein